MAFDERTLRLFRAVMPGVAGVVLASTDGRSLAHDVRADEMAQGLADAAERPARGASTFVERDGALYLVVFVPPDVASAPGAGALAVA